MEALAPVFSPPRLAPALREGVPGGLAEGQGFRDGVGFPFPMRDALEAGPFPEGDGWSGLYRAFRRVAPRGSASRRLVCGYLYPAPFERWRDGLAYRALGVGLFGRVVPTGGILVRRLTGARMTPYTLAASSASAARAFYYRACVFEALHLPFFLTLVALAAHRTTIGRTDLAIELTVINLVVNLYPMLHHRRTRCRIVRLLERRRRTLGSSRAGEG